MFSRFNRYLVHIRRYHCHSVGPCQPFYHIALSGKNLTKGYESSYSVRQIEEIHVNITDVRSQLGR